jgi:hypothetical protein
MEKLTKKIHDHKIKFSNFQFITTLSSIPQSVLPHVFSP